MTTDRLSKRLAKIEAVSNLKSFVLFVDDDGVPLPGQTVGPCCIIASKPISLEEWEQKYGRQAEPPHGEPMPPVPPRLAPGRKPVRD